MYFPTLVRSSVFPRSELHFFTVGTGLEKYPGGWPEPTFPPRPRISPEPTSHPEPAFHLPGPASPQHSFRWCWPGAGAPSPRQNSLLSLCPRLLLRAVQIRLKAFPWDSRSSEHWLVPWSMGARRRGPLQLHLLSTLPHVPASAVADCICIDCP